MAILGGLGAAVAWAVTLLCTSRATRMIGSGSVLAWVMLVGFCIVVPWAALAGVPDELDRGSATWLLVAGLGNIVGLLLVYTALREGKVGIVGPIVSTEGAIAAVLAVLAGEHLAAGSAAMLALIAVGITLAATTAESSDVSEVASAVDRATSVPVIALLAACSFGTSIYATARASADLPIAWAVAPPRVLGVLLVFVPLAATSRLRVTRPSVPLVVTAGIAEVVGFALFAVGSRHGVAVAAVLASQFAAIAAVAAYFLFKERLSRVQLAGVATIVAGVAILTALQA
jgi:drug/metabolite transporter (DMT)-like permease